MAKIPCDDILGFMIEALSQCNFESLLQSDGEINCHKFEQVDVGITSFFHSKCVEKLLASNSISEDIASRCLQIYEKWTTLTSQQNSTGEIRTSHQWLELFEDVDNVMPLLMTCNYRIITP